MEKKYRPVYQTIVNAIDEHELSKEDLLRQIDDEYATKRITSQEYFDAISRLDERY